MRILLDECIDRRLGRRFIDHEVKTVPQMGWAGTLDGDLLPLVAAKFDVFITVDRNLILEAIPIAPKGEAMTIALVK